MASVVLSNVKKKLSCEKERLLEQLFSIKVKKNDFINSLKSKSGYKRCVVSPLRYAGGKSLAVGYIVEHLPDHLKRVVSPFFGGGSVEIAFAKHLGVDVVGYDVFDILVNYWQIQIKSPKKLAEKLSQLKPKKDQYALIKEKLKAHWLGKKSLEPLDLAVCYYFNHNLSYGPGFLGWMSSIYENETRYQSLLKRIREFETRGSIKVKHSSFERSIPKHRDDFMYLDPPYYLEGDSKMFRGIYPQRNFPIHHNGFDHQKLAQLLMKHKGGFILSYNDCEYVRKLYDGFKIVKIGWQYTMGQGEMRIGFNRLLENRGYVKKSHEILIIGERS